MLFPQAKGLAGSAGVALIGDLDVTEHCCQFPGERVEIETTLPEPGPSCGRVTDPFGSPLRVGVPTVGSDHLGDRTQPRPAQPFQMWPASQQGLSLGAVVVVAAVGFLTRSMGDGIATTESFTVTVDGDTNGPFPAGPSPTRVSFRGQILTFEVAESTGGNTGAFEIEVYIK